MTDPLSVHVEPESVCLQRIGLVEMEMVSFEDRQIDELMTK